MRFIRQLAIILIFSFLGELISRTLSLPIPGNVLGMVFLVICLCTGIIKVEAVDEVSDFLLEYLPFFFVPAGVGLISSVAEIKTTWPFLLIMVVISTLIAMTVTGLIVQALKRS